MQNSHRPHAKKIQGPLARRRDETVICGTCGRRVPRKSRQQTYCSIKCQKRGAYAKKVADGFFSGTLTHHSGRGCDPHKKLNGFKPLQGAKSRSRVCISGPREVIAAEIVDGRAWHETVSSDGVHGLVTMLRTRAISAGPT